MADQVSTNLRADTAPRIAASNRLLRLCFLLSLLVAVAIPAAASGQSSAQLPLALGDLVATSFGGDVSGLDPSLFVVSLIDVRVPPVGTNPVPVAGSPWAPPSFHNLLSPPNEWTGENLGQVFGLCLDAGNPRNMYVTATSLYGDMTLFPWPNGGFGPAGPGGVYRIDGTTGAITVFATLPNSASALGNICFDPVHAQFFVTNLEDGLIYQLNSSGAVINTHDPWNATIATPGSFAPLGERPYAVRVLGDRLYFSNWFRDVGRPSTLWTFGTPPASPNNSIWSIAIDNSTGALVGPDTLEFVVPYLALADTHSAPVTDISFSESGVMLISERTMAQDYGIIDLGHGARCLEYNFSGSWVPSLTEYWVGVTAGPHNAAGGIDYDCDGSVWAGADGIPGGYGLQNVPVGGNTQATSVATSNLIPFPSGLKAGNGDVEAVRNCPCQPMTDLICLDVSDPAAPQHDIDLTWTNNSYYSSIEVFCDGSLLATLPGSATSYSIAFGFPVSCCEVIAYDALGALCSQLTCCPCQPITGLTCLDVSPPGAPQHDVDLSWTNNDNYSSIEVICDGLSVAILPGTATSYSVVLPIPITCCTVIAYDALGAICSQLTCCLCLPMTDLTCTDISSPGAPQHDIQLNWTNNDTYSSIDIFCDGFFVANLPGTDTTFTVLLGAPTFCCTVIAYDAQGAICSELTCCIECLPITNFTCTDVSLPTAPQHDVDLNWINNGNYSSIDVLCDGIPIATLPGTDTTYSVLLPHPVNCCTVIAYDSLGQFCSTLTCCIVGCAREDAVHVFDTGLDQLSGLISTGNSDDDWVVIRDTDLSGNPISASTEPVSADVRSPNPSYDTFPGTRWIQAPAFTSPSVVHYQFCFCLREGFTSVLLDMAVLADDDALVYLNGTQIIDTSLTGSSGWVFPASQVTLTNPSLFVAGSNCLEIVVTNTIGDGGLNVSGFVTADGGKCCCTPAPHGMVGWWPLDEPSGTVAADITRSNDGDYELGFPALLSSPGLVGRSMFFDEFNLVRVVPTNTQLDIGPSITGVPGSGDFSVDAWIALADSRPVNPIAAKAEPGGGPGFVFYVIDDERLALLLSDGASSQIYTSNIGVPPGAGGGLYLLTAGFPNPVTVNWYHVTVTVDRDQVNGVKFYVNGYRADNNAQDLTAQLGSLINPQDFFIAHTENSTLGFWDYFGQIDEVEVFDRVLSAGEIRAISEAGEHGKCKDVCHVPTARGVASGGTLTINATLCNYEAFSQTYTVTSNGLGTGVAGCTLAGTTLSHAATVTVPPGGCVTVPLTVTAPTGAPATTETSCYEVRFTSLETGSARVCRGSLRVNAPVIVTRGTGFRVGLAPGASHPVEFVVQNPSGAAQSFSYVVEARPRGLDRRGTIVSLDGLPPGSSVSGTVTIPAFDSTTLTVDATAAHHEPFLFHDVVLSTDLAGPGTLNAVETETLFTEVPDLAPPAITFIRGDSNDDAALDIADTIYLLSALFTGGPSPACSKSADANDDGAVDIADGIYGLGFLFSGGASPPAPFPACGSDPTDDTLDCQSYSSCP